MSTVTLRSGQARESGYVKHPEYRVHLEPSPKRIRAIFNGITVADSTRAQLLYETRHLPVYYFPRAAISWQHFAPTAHSTFCPYKGEAHYWSVSGGDRREENVLWAYPAPFPEVPELAGYVSLYWNKMDRWLEEDEEVFVHPRDPYVRIDVLASQREVKVIVGGETVAQSRQALFLFETGLPTRYYLPREDVRVDRLRESANVTRCPYKGNAHHFRLRAEDDQSPDVAWVYRNPVAEVARIKDRICFYHERIDGISIDGETLAVPQTNWSI